MQTLKIIYLAKFRDIFNTSEETLSFENRQCETLQDLLTLLISRGSIWQETLNPQRKFGVIINQQLAKLDSKLPDFAEVAFFPPITGG